MYLGQITTPAQNQAAYQAAPAGNALDTMNLDKWNNRVDDEVTVNDFTGNDLPVGMNRTPIVNVFPMGPKDILRTEDMLAITSSINSQDCLIAFAQIMFKRFFANDTLAYVETGGWEGKGKTNNPNAAIANIYQGGLGRCALTSNDYPTFKYGPINTMSVQRHWEIVMIRPNIEHNMLGVILGRGGINELGATFWGQTELSCYDDSMHGMVKLCMFSCLCSSLLCARHVRDQRKF